MKSLQSGINQKQLELMNVKKKKPLQREIRANEEDKGKKRETHAVVRTSSFVLVYAG